MRTVIVTSDTQDRYNQVLFNLLLAYLFAYVVFPKFLAVSVGFLYLSMDRIILFLLFSALLIGIFVFKETRLNLYEQWTRNKVFILLILLISLLQLISIYKSVDTVTSVKRYMNHTLAILVPFFVILSLNESTMDLRKLGKWMLIAISILIGVLAIELFIEKNVFENFLAGESLTDFQQQQLEAKIRGESRRIQGTFANPLSLGQFILLVVPFLIFLKPYLNKNTLINFLVICLLIFSLFIKSRTVFLLTILLMVMLSYQFFISKRYELEFKVWSLFAIVLGTFAFILFVYGQIDLDTYFGGHKLTEDESRTAQLVKGLPLIANSWQLGYGYGMGAQTLDFGTLGGKSGTIDNYFLTIALDSGLVTLFVFVVFYLKCFWTYLKVHETYKFLYIGMILFLINLFTLSLTEVHPIFYVFLGLVLTGISAPLDNNLGSAR